MILLKKKKFILFFIVWALQISCYADIILPHVLSDNMVVQQNSLVKLWGKANPNASVLIRTSWNSKDIYTKTDKNGDWAVQVKTLKASYKAHSISIKCNKEEKKLKNVLFGEVWICSGQSNMSMPMAGYPSQPINGALDAIVESESLGSIRMFTAQRIGSITKKSDVNGAWEMASINTTAAFSAIGYFYALELHKILNVPIGIINISWGGSKVQAWMSNESIKKIPQYNDIRFDSIPKTAPAQTPTMLYNGMFYPLSNYRVKGVVWYQGESNVSEDSLYREMFPLMVQEWRKDLNSGEIPFYYVQIAPYKYENSNGNRSAFMREAQLDCLQSIPNSGMAVAMDLGNENNIHPSEKKIISRRLAYLALAKTYGYTKLPCLSPTYRSKEIKNNKVVLTFENVANGLISTTDILEGFEVADKTQHFVKANAKIVKPNQVEVWNDEIKDPAEVRYCFKNYAVGTLFNSFGFPASSFRTDKIAK